MILSVALALLSVTSMAFRRSGSSFRHLDGSIRRSGSSFRHSNDSIRRFDSSFRHLDRFPSLWLFFPSPRWLSVALTLLSIASTILSFALILLSININNKKNKNYLQLD
jgi:hypothetical protein